MTERCGQVEPHWVRLRDIQWAGHPKPEPNFMIEYRRCPCTDTALRATKYGRGWFCLKHAGMQLYANASVYINGKLLQEGATVEVQGPL